ncbi:nosL family protein [Anoxybacillus sp. B7M1]|nr:nosL family protein [Anoxybacillus sp. B2M1]ANB62706.1 nosL family protein [Anoxybacillus sp. B7M1]
MHHSSMYMEIGTNDERRGKEQMKKWLQKALVSTTSLWLLAGCVEKEATPSTNQQKSQSQADVQHVQNSEEPQEGTTCAFCNMKVYSKNEELGKFTAKLIKANGQVVFFDDIGCMLNYERDMKEEGAKKYVRDYQTYDWIEMDQAIVVKADIQTPMKYGFALFKDKEEAEEYVQKHPDVHAMLSDWDAVDEVALKKYNMKKMNQGDMNDMNGEMNHSQHMNGQ